MIRHGILETSRKKAAAGPTYPTSGLVARYAFEDNLNDTSGNGYHLTLGGGSAAYDTGISGKAFKFNGSTYLAAPSQVYSILDGTNQWTIAWWCRVPSGYANFNSFNSPGGGSYYTRMWNYNNGHWIANRTNGGGFNTGNNCINYSATPYIFSHSTWYLWIFRKTATGIAGLVNNGACAVNHNFISDTGTNGTHTSLTIGGGPDGNASNNTLFDSMYFYNKALDTTEMAQLWNDGAGV